MKHWRTTFDAFCFMLTTVLPHVLDGVAETTIRASANSRVVVPCTSSTSDDVMWSFRTMSPDAESVEVSMNGQILKGFEDRFELDKSNVNQYNLVIRSARFGDAGQYTCDEQNGIGDRHVVHLNVTDAVIVTVSIQNSTAVAHIAAASSATTEYDSGQTDNQKVGLLVGLAVVFLAFIVVAIIAVFLALHVRKRRRKESRETESEKHPLRNLPDASNDVKQSDISKVDGNMPHSLSAGDASNDDKQSDISKVDGNMPHNLSADDASNAGKQSDISKVDGNMPHSLGADELRDAVRKDYTDDDAKRVRDTLIFSLASKNRRMFTECAQQMADLIKNLPVQPDVIIGLNGYDSRGDILAWEISGKLDLPFVEMVQTKGLGYGGNVHRHTFKSEIPGDNEDYTIEMLKSACKKGQKVVLVDNSVQTGATMKAAIDLAKNKFEVEVVMCLCLVNDVKYAKVPLSPKLHHIFEI